MKHIPKISRRINGGTQDIYRFCNGYGASVVQHSFSYGIEFRLWELAVVKYSDDKTGDLQFSLTYDTPITDDVIGSFSKATVVKILNKIAKLPPREAA